MPPPDHREHSRVQHFELQGDCRCTQQPRDTHLSPEEEVSRPRSVAKKINWRGQRGQARRRRCTGRSSSQGSSPRRPVEVSSGLLRLPRLHAPAIADDAARARCPSGRTAAPPPRRRSEPPRAPWYLKCPAALGDGVDAPRRHLRAKVTVSNCH